MITTIEALQKFNDDYGRYIFPVSTEDFAKSVRIARAIESTRSDVSPMPGDVIICQGPNRTYDSGHMENPVGEYSSICVQPYVPFAGEYDGKPSFSTSGGYWFSCDEVEMFVKQPTVRTKTFCVFGSHGPCGNGAFYFTAEVNVWSIFKESIY